MLGLKAQEWVLGPQGTGVGTRTSPQGVGARAVDVQTGPVRSDRDAGQYHVHPHSDERRPLPGYLTVSLLLSLSSLTENQFAH